MSYTLNAYRFASRVVPAVGLFYWQQPVLADDKQIPLSSLRLPALGVPQPKGGAQPSSRIASGVDVGAFQRGLAGRKEWSLVDVVGGHEGMLTNGQYVLKPMQNSSRGVREATFYETVEALAKQEPELRSIFPAYYGVVQSRDAASNLNRAAESNELPADASWLKLQDLTAGLSRPCIADIKLGTRTWSPGSSDRKRRKAIARYPEQLVTGYRFTGMRVATNCTTSACLAPSSETVLQNRLKEGSELQLCSALESSTPHACVTLHRRLYGRTLGHLHGAQGWLDFLHDGRSVRWDVVPHILSQLKQVQAWLQRQRRFEFYSSSLLVVYDGAGPPESALVRLIDFAHAKDNLHGSAAAAPSRKGDRGTLVGIQNLISSLEVLQGMQKRQETLSPTQVRVVACSTQQPAASGELK